ncbi:hypothetical protein VPH35_136592 [Triticum aestivum]
MAGSADRHQSRRRRRSGGEIEEGEVGLGYYTGSDTDTDDEDARYYLQPRHDDRGRQGLMTVARSLPGAEEDVIGGGTRSITRASSPASSLASDGTISNVGGRGDAAAVTVFPACPVCHRQFHSSKAVHGHMRAQLKEEKVSAAVSTVDEVDDSVSVSMASVLAEPKISDDPMPMEVASSGDHVVPGSGSNSNSSASVEPTQSSADQSMAIVVAAAAPPAAISEQVDIAPTPPALQQVPVLPPVAPAPEPAAVYLHQPAPALAEQHVGVPSPPTAAPPHAFHGLLHLNTMPYQDPAARLRAPAGDNQHGFWCKECYRWFPTHQRLGGHVAGHKNRRIAAVAAAAIAAGVDPIDHAAGGPRPERFHTFKVCGAVYNSGVSLGGHMRKHYQGKPIVPRKRPHFLFRADLGLGIPMPPPAVEAPVVAPPVAEVVAQPPQAPEVPAGSLRIFGVTIVHQGKEEEEPPSTTSSDRYHKHAV